MQLSTFLLAATAIAPAFAQLSGKVGPLTTHASKSAVKICNVLDYGAKADKATDLSPALLSAFTACKAGGTVVIPSGDYALATWVTFEGGKAWALQLDGVIYRTGSASGNMLFVRNADDFEMFSSMGKGAVQGYGYQDHKNGKRNEARILRLEQTDNFSVHDIKLVDAPMFHFVMHTCTNGEAYNMAIRGGEEGGLDGVDVTGTNIWIHDIMVTNKDECVTVKSPSKNILIENIYCNSSGGCAIGSLAVNTAISSIVYRNIYTSKSNQMMMIKSNGGSGYLEDVLFENFIGHGNAYSFDIDQAWASMTTLPGDGVQLTNITARNWKGTVANGAQRGPVKVVCADKTPCTGITIEDFAMWTEVGSKVVNRCKSAYGIGACLKSGIGGAYAPVMDTQTSAPEGYEAESMTGGLEEGFGIDEEIPIPEWPVRFYPGQAPITKLAG
ncbi:Glycoside hydrolase family 28 [Pyrenophora tritici-repentis]|nr:Glycoside hydrolase family 28 [Pyrenophora tritici-repentis]